MSLFNEKYKNILIRNLENFIPNLERPRLCLDHVDANLCESVGCLWCPGGPQDQNVIDCFWPDIQ